MAIKSIIGATFTCLAVVSFNASAALIGRLSATPGGSDYQAYYDDQLDITWLADANAIGQVDWSTANNWANSLVIDGVTGWRLPNMDVNGDAVVVDCTSSTQADCKDNEYGHLFYYGSGTTFDNGISSSNHSPFSDVQGSSYWSNNTTVAFNLCNSSSGRACMASAGSYGSYGSYGLPGPYYAWAVHNGDIGAVPVPASVWLMGSGLIGLIGLARRKKL